MSRIEKAGRYSVAKVSFNVGVISQMKYTVRDEEGRGVLESMSRLSNIGKIDEKRFQEVYKRRSTMETPKITSGGLRNEESRGKYWD